MEDEKKQNAFDEDDIGDLKQELKGGLAVYGVLVLCATMSLLPMLFSDGAARFRIPEGSRILKSSVRVVSFFALDGKESAEQIAELTVLRIKYPDEKIEIIAACTEFKHPEAVTAFAERIKAPFPIVAGPNELAAYIEQGGNLPITIVRDGKGNPVHVFRRLATAEQIAEQIKKILK